MSRFTYLMNVSLDGFVARPNGELDWTVVNEELHTFFNDQQREVGASLYGRRLYETMRYWDTAEQDASLAPYELEFARIWKNIPKIVISTTLEQVQGNATLVKENVAEELRELKRKPGKDVAVGGPTLAATCINLGLIDEYGLVVHPVVLGSGLPFFPTRDSVLNLQLVETRQFESGVVYLRYHTNNSS